MKIFDVAVVGLGAMGSAAVWQLARRGQRVVGLDRFAPGHERGSSHGATRIIRLGYFEHPAYVPLVRRAYKLWNELEAATGSRLLEVTGIAEIGPPNGSLVSGTLAAAQAHDLPHTVLAASDLMRRFPGFRVPADYVGVVQRDGGLLKPEPAIAALLRLAKAAGADLRTGQRVRALEPRAAGVRIVTDHGSIEAGTAVVAAGPWVTTLLPDLGTYLRVTRQVTAWFDPFDPALFRTPAFAVFILESRHGLLYGFPLDAIGVKVGKHYHCDETVDPDTYDRSVSAQDEAVIRAALADHLPAVNHRMRMAQTCLYTMAPDGHFLIDWIVSPHILVVSACSGHGFKFAPVIGEIVADLAIQATTAHDIARFRLDRFERGAGPQTP
ncbi:MAG TPA: N-methyl-L-tryptophan oxidase [Xanthobacteraceae bacterium]|nr:N-methyl-L-tryptophan oxidase [Xanthobacteraceae bacterium]